MQDKTSINKKKKVFFAPVYFYSSMPDYMRIIRKLDNNNIDSKVIKLSENQSDKLYNDKYFNDNNISFINLYDLLNLKMLDITRKTLVNTNSEEFSNLLKKIIKGEKIYHKFGRAIVLRLIKLTKKLIYNIIYWIGFTRILKYLKKERPDLLVISSDLSYSSYISFFSEACRLLNVPVVILWMWDIEIQKERGFKEKFYNYLSYRLAFINLKLIRYIRTRFFCDNIVGKFARYAKIFLISEDGRRKLIQSGVSKNRIKVVSLPTKESDSLLKEKIHAELKIPRDNKLVVFYTETLQYIYGIDYVRDLHVHLVEIFQKISSVYPVNFIIKIHPKDKWSIDSNEFFSRDVYEYLIKQTFEEKGFKVLSEFDPEQLIESADLNIAHYSKILITCTMKKKLFLSINLKNDEERTFIPPQFREKLEARDYEQIETKILASLFNLDYEVEIQNLINQMSNNYHSYNTESIITCMKDQLCLSACIK